MAFRPRLRQRTVSGFIWVVFGTGSQFVCQIVTLLVLARLLTPMEFGIVSGASIVTQLAMIFAQLGVGPALIQRKEITDAHISVGKSLALVTGFFVFGCVYVAADLLSTIFRIMELGVVLKVYAATFLIRSFAIVPEALAQRKLEFKSLAIIDSVSFLAGYAAIGICLALFGYSYWSLVAAHLGQSILRAGLVVWYLGSPVQPKVHFVTEAKQLLHYGFGQSIGRLANYFGNQSDNFVVARYIGTAELGEYGRAYQLMVMPANLLGHVFDKTLFPAMSLMQSTPSKMGLGYCHALRCVSLLTMPLAVVFAVFADEIVLLALGDQWRNVPAILQVFAVGLIFRMVNKISDATTRASGAIYQRAGIQVGFAVLMLSLAFAGLLGGLLGVAVGVTVAMIISTVIFTVLCSRLTDTRLIIIARSAAGGWRLAFFLFFIVLIGKLSIHAFQIAPVLGFVLTSVAATILGMAGLVIFPTVVLGTASIETLMYLKSASNNRFLTKLLGYIV